MRDRFHKSMPDIIGQGGPRLVPRPERSEERVRQLATLDANGAATITLPRRRVGQPAIVSRLIASIPAATTTPLRDSFNRAAVATGWGNPDLGPPYGLLSGAAAQFSTSGTVGNVLTGGAAVQLLQSVVSAIDANLLCVITRTGTLGFTNRICVRVQDASNYLYSELNVAGGGFDTVRIGQRIGGVDTVLATSAVFGAALPGSTQWRFRAIGSALDATAWNVATAEPAAQVAVISQSLSLPGGVAFGRPLASANFTFDDILATVTATSPIWDSYIDNTGQLLNLIDSSVVAVDRWIPQITNGQRLNPGEQLVIAPRSGIPNSQAVVTCSFVYAT